jgi:hypothetical protein
VAFSDNSCPASLPKANSVSSLAERAAKMPSADSGVRRHAADSSDSQRMPTVECPGLELPNQLP